MRPSSHRSLLPLVACALLTFTPLGAPAAHAQAMAPAVTGMARLEAEIARLAETAGGTVGVGAIHLETGREVHLNGEEAFPQASVLVTGVEDPDTRAHGANEGLHLAEFEKVVLAEAFLLRNLGALGK